MREEVGTKFEFSRTWYILKLWYEVGCTQSGIPDPGIRRRGPILTTEHEVTMCVCMRDIAVLTMCIPWCDIHNLVWNLS